MSNVKLCIQPFNEKATRIVVVPFEKWDSVKHYYERPGFSVEDHAADEVTNQIALRWPEYAVKYENPHDRNDCIILR